MTIKYSTNVNAIIVVEIIESHGICEVVRTAVKNHNVQSQSIIPDEIIKSKIKQICDSFRKLRPWTGTCL